MRTAARFRFVAIAGLTVALLSAGIGLAANAFDGSDDPQPTVCPTDDQVTSGDEPVVGATEEPGDTEGDTEEPGDTEGDTEEPGDTEGDTEEPGDTEGDTEEPGDTDDDQDCDDEAAEDETAEDADEAGNVQAADEPNAEHVQACIDEASDTQADLELDPNEAPIPGEKQGLENAISHVFWNCVHHENDGLVNALDHLTDNLDAKLEREELREERAASREAAKAEREADRDAAKAEREAAREAAKAAREAAHGS
jgi:hypothetical protein